MSGPRILTFGCRLNAFESEVMRRHAEGLSDTVIVNSCAVTAEAERQVRQAIRRVRRERPGARIVVTGCAAQLAPGRYAAMDEVDRVVGNAEKLRPGTWRESGPPVEVGDIMTVRETASHLAAGFEGRARAFVEIQQGCDHRCTFCIIPFARGNSRSTPAGAVVERVRGLAAGGFREVVLTGVDLTGYGGDLPGRPRLGALVRRLLALVPELPRLRLSSLDPAEIDDELLSVVAEEPRLMPHFHLSAQSGDDTVLKRMKRRHDRAGMEELAARLRALRPDAVLGADLIAGFPTETDDAFRNSLSLVESCGLTWLHVFPYSPRPGTPAARMPQVEGRIRRARAAELRALGRRRAGRFLESCVGKTLDVLVEKDGEGRSPHFAAVRVGGRPRPGAVVRARVVGREGDRLVARRAA